MANSLILLPLDVEQGHATNHHHHHHPLLPTTTTTTAAATATRLSPHKLDVVPIKIVIYIDSLESDEMKKISRGKNVARLTPHRCCNEEV